MDDRTRTPERAPDPGGLPTTAVLLGGLSVGLAVDVLLRSSGGPGLNILLMYLVLAGSVGVVTWRAGYAPSREAAAWLATGLLFASEVVLRADPDLQFLAFLCAAAAFAFPALRSGAAWLRRSGVSEPIEAVAGAVAWAGLGPLRLAAEGWSRVSAAPAPMDGKDRVLPGLARGVLLATPLLLVFGALFMSADRVFAELVADVFRFDYELVASHLVVTAVFGWLACGYLTGFLSGTRLRGLVESHVPRPYLGLLEVGTALALVDVLFTAFVAVQFRYLFGGATLVEVTPGLTYAEYAREGFGQLALAAALVLPTLLLSEWVLRNDRPRDIRVFRALGGIQLLLLAVVIASAVQRVRVYQDAYGLTESRFYGTWFLGWLVLVAAWFGATVLRGRRERFASTALLSAFAAAALLIAVNPHAWIARANLERADVAGAVRVRAERPDAGDEAGARERPPAPGHLDVEYLASLSPDAAPVLLDALPDLPPGVRCTLARSLLADLERAPEDWRSWTLAAARARRAVEAREADLRAMVPPSGDCS